VVERPNSRFAKTPEILLVPIGANDSVCPCNSLALLGFLSSAGVAKRDDFSLHRFALILSARRAIEAGLRVVFLGVLQKYPTL
jgi:hypothetical protein